MSRYTLFDRDSCLTRVISAWCLYRKEANNRLLRLVAEVNDGTVR